MRVKYHFPVKSSFPIPEKWPIRTDKYIVDLSEEKGRVNSIAVSVALDGSAQLPKHIEPNDPNIDFAIDIGNTASNDDVAQFLINVQGLLSLWGTFVIDFSNCTTEWVPENEEEKRQIELNNWSLKIGKPRLDELTPVPFELLARAIFTAPHVMDYEVPLSFIRCGNEDIGQDRYIEAFYHFFFFLETLFAPGSSSPKQFVTKFTRAKPIREAIAQARQDRLLSAHFKTKELAALLSKTDEELIKDLVKTRGNLHHHSRGTAHWHPEKSSHYEAEAKVIQYIAFTIAVNEGMARVFAPEWYQQFMQSVKDVGGTNPVRVDAIEVINGQQRQVASIYFDCPGQRPNHRMIAHIHLDVRDMIARDRGKRRFSSYRFSSADGRQHYASYQCHLLERGSRAVVRKGNDEGTQ